MMGHLMEQVAVGSQVAWKRDPSPSPSPSFPPSLLPSLSFPPSLPSLGLFCLRELGFVLPII